MEKYLITLEKHDRAFKIIIVAGLLMIAADINMHIAYGICYLAGNDWLMNICETFALGIGLLGVTFSPEVIIYVMYMFIYDSWVLRKIKKRKEGK